jgi:hypothetical protein
MRLSDLDFSAMLDRSNPKRWGAGDPSQDRRLYCNDSFWFKILAPEYIQSQSYISNGKYVDLGSKTNDLFGFRIGYFDETNASAFVDFIYDHEGVLRGYVSRAGQVLSAVPREFARAAAQRSIDTGWVMADLGSANVVDVAGKLSMIDYDTHFCELGTIDLDYERLNGCFARFRDPYYAGLLEGYIQARHRDIDGQQT